MKYNGCVAELDKEAVVETVCEWIKDDVEQEIFEILEKIKISRSSICVVTSDVEGFVESYLEPSELEYELHEENYDYGIMGEMDVLDCIFK